MGKLPAQTSPPPVSPAWQPLFRTVGAVITGYIIITLLVTVPWLLLAKIAPGQFSTAHTEPTLIAFVVDSLIAVVAGLTAGYLTGWIAGRAEIAHTMTLGTLLAVLSLITVLLPDSTNPLPGWHSFLLIVIMWTTLCLGARFRQSHRLAYEKKQE